MRRSVLVRILAIGALAWLLVLPAATAAFPLSNCTMQLSSTTAGGAALDTAQSGDGSGSESDPFLVDWDGTVSWSGTVQVEMKNNSYHIEVFGIPTPLRGTNSNEGDNRTGSGTVGISANAPFRFTGLYFVSGAITGSGGTCEGSGVFKLTGDPVGTVPFWTGLGLLGVGVLLLAWGLQGHRIGGIVGGLLAGLGAAVLLIIFAALPLGGITPPVVAGLGLILGIAEAMLVRPRAAPALPI